MLKEGFLSAKYADPVCVVGLGGLANHETSYPGVVFVPPEQFLQGVYDQGGGSYFDYVDRHPYPRLDRRDPNEVLLYVDGIRQVMVSNGDDTKPVAVFEIGVPNVYGVSEQDVADSMPALLDACLQRDFVWAVSWYNLRDKGTDPNDPEHHFGLVHRDWSKKATYYAYRDYIGQH